MFKRFLFNLFNLLCILKTLSTFVEIFEMKIDLSDQERNEYAEFLKSKKGKLAQEMNKVDETLSKLFNEPKEEGERMIIVKPENTTLPNVKPTEIGWKFLIDDILKNANGQKLSRSQIIEIFQNDLSQPQSRRDVAHKSIGSAVFMNSTKEKQRYLFDVVNDVKYYYLNEDYKE